MKDVVAYTGEQEREPFNPHKHLMDIKNRNGKTEYLPVQWRLVWFREQCPNGTIETEAVLIDLDKETEEETYAWNNETRRSEKVIKRANGIAIFRAVVKDGKGGIGTGTKSEKAASFPDFIEKAETGSIGRALAALGYGTQFVGDEFDENPRIVDAPVERAARTPTEQEKQTYQQRKPFVEGSVAKEEKPADAATDQQLASIRKLCQHLGKSEPEEELTYLQAKEMLATLSAEYRQSREKATKSEAPSEGEPESSPEQASYGASISRDGMITDQQKGWLRILSKKLGEKLPVNMDHMTFDNAKKYIDDWNAEVAAKRSSLPAQRAS